MSKQTTKSGQEDMVSGMLNSLHREDTQNGETVSMPIEFARAMIKQLVFNPKKNQTANTYSFAKYTRENIVKWLQTPSSNEINLRKASNYMYLASMHYNRLINYYAGLYPGSYVISPVGFDKNNVKAEQFAKQYRKVSAFIEQMDIPNLLHTVATVCLRDGVFYGVKWYDKSSSFVQQLNPDICKISSIMNGSFLFSVDMSQLSSKLEFYPDVFTTMYTQYLATGEKYQEVPADIAFCVKADNSYVDVTVPPFAAVMPSLYEIATVENLKAASDEIENYKMIAGQVPTDSAGNPLMGWDVVMKYYGMLEDAVGDNPIGLAVTPFKLDQFSFDKGGNTGAINEITKTVANFWSTAGTSGLLHGIANDTSGVTRLSITNDETFVLPILRQFERTVNRTLQSNFSGSTRFKLTMLPVTVFNRTDYAKMYKEAASFGVGKSYYAAAVGIPQSDIAGLSYIEENLAGFDELNPLQSSYNISGQNAGRPAASDSELGDAGEVTRDTDANENR